MLGSEMRSEGSMSITSVIMVQDSTECEVIDTRFGKVTIDKSKPVIFPKGLLGLPNKFHFSLTEFPSEKLRQFKLLQSQDDYALSFITLPIDVKNPIIAQDDILNACRDLGFDAEDLVVLLIVTVHRSPTEVKLSVNARAPLFIDAGKRLAAQYVFVHDKYSVQHMISA